MHDMFLMRRGQALGDLQSVLDHSALGKRSPAQSVAQRLPFEEL